jgi:nickel transport protein
MRRLNFRQMVVSAFLVASTLMSSQALAHKLSVFAYAEGNKVFVEGYFADGKKAQNSKVQAFNSAGKVVAEGTTNDKGQYFFDVSKADDLKIVINAGMGHRGVYNLPATELGDGTAAAEQPAAQPEPAPQQQAAAAGDTPQVETTEPAVASNQQLERVVHKAVNEAIMPLVRELDETRQKNSLRDLLGAVGFIFGFMGLFFFFKARQQGSDKQS